MNSKKGCWTCKDRRVRCDGARPTCANCTRVKRKCAGYGIRLSWPRKNDAKRAKFLQLQQHQQHQHNSQYRRSYSSSSTDVAQFVSIHPWDYELYNFLSEMNSSALHRKSLTDPSSLLRITKPLSPFPSHIRRAFSSSSSSSSFSPSSSSSEDEESLLFSYFHSVSFVATLTSFSPSISSSSSSSSSGGGAGKLRDLVIRLALLGNSPASKAIWYSLVATASLHRQGYGKGEEGYGKPGLVSPRAARYRLLAIKALIASSSFSSSSSSSGMGQGQGQGGGEGETSTAATKTPLDDPATAAQHVAASMLLSSFEAKSLCEESAGQWIWYVSGAREVVKMAALQGWAAASADISDLLDWVHFQHVLAGFSLHHWRKGKFKRIYGNINALPEEEEEAPLSPPLPGFSTRFVDEEEYGLLSPPPPPPPPLKTLQQKVLRLLEQALAIPISDDIDEMAIVVNRHMYDHHRKKKKSPNPAKQQQLPTTEPSSHHLPSRLKHIKSLLDTAQSLYTEVLSLSSSSSSQTHSPTTSPSPSPSQDLIYLELFHLATLIYLFRIHQSYSYSYSSSSSLPEPLTHRLFTHLLPNTQSLTPFFPAYILGVEAGGTDDDEKRRIFLELIARTEKELRIREMTCVRFAVRMAWAMDDLGEEEEEEVEDDDDNDYEGVGEKKQREIAEREVEEEEGIWRGKKKRRRRKRSEVGKKGLDYRLKICGVLSTGTTLPGIF